MTLTNTKIVFILLLTTTLLSLSSCAAMDDDDMGAPDNKFGEGSNSVKEVLASNCISLPGGSDPSVGLDTLFNDTLKVFPDDAIFHKLLMQSIVSSQGMAKVITRSIDGSVDGPGSNYWMDYYSPYLGVYSSYNDSRSKQWNLEQDAAYESSMWDYHLCILDLPEGVAPDNSGVRAVEAFYNSDFNKGVVTFSPTDFDAVRFPKKIFGPDIMGMLSFVFDGGVTTNELYLTNIGVNNNVMYIRNVYLYTESANSCVAIKAMIDFPTLWFDTKANSGFTVSVIGAYDLSTGGAVLYSGIVRNSSNEKSVASLVLDHPSDEVLANYYPLWQKMMQENENNSSPEAPDGNNETDGNQETGEAGETGDNTGDNPGVGSIVLSVTLKEAGAAVEEQEEVEVEYGKPGYYLYGEYVPTSMVGDKTPYLKALNKCLDMMDGDFPISPYKNSVNQVEWMTVEKSR